MLPGLQEFLDGMHIYVADQIASATGEEAGDHHSIFDNGGLATSVLQFLGPNCGLTNPHVQHGSLHPQNVGSTDGSGFTHQTTPFTCAVVSQKMVLDSFGVVDPTTGQPVTESGLMYDGLTHGWLDSGGTSIANMGKLLDYYGVSCHHGSDWHSLVRELADGHQVVIAVNAGELWTDHGPLAPLMHLFGNRPNHAIVLKGLKVDERGHVSVVVNDPGQVAGAGVEYSLDHFQAGLEARNFHYIATDHPPPGCSSQDVLAPDLPHHGPPAGASSFAADNPLGAIDSFVSAVARMCDGEKTAFLKNI